MAVVSGKILVAQGGGPTAVINQSLVGVALEARRFGTIGRIYGALHGVRGIVDENLVDLTQETTHNLELVACTPSSALGSTRDKPDLAYCQEIFKVRMLDAGGVVSQSGKVLSATMDSICVHGDTPGAVDSARRLRHALETAGWQLAGLTAVVAGRA